MKVSAILYFYLGRCSLYLNKRKKGERRQHICFGCMCNDLTTMTIKVLCVLSHYVHSKLLNSTLGYVSLKCFLHLWPLRILVCSHYLLPIFIALTLCLSFIAFSLTLPISKYLSAFLSFVNFYASSSLYPSLCLSVCISASMQVLLSVSLCITRFMSHYVSLFLWVCVSIYDLFPISHCMVLDSFYISRSIFPVLLFPWCLKMHFCPFRWQWMKKYVYWIYFQMISQCNLDILCIQSCTTGQELKPHWRSMIWMGGNGANRVNLQKGEPWEIRYPENHPKKKYIYRKCIAIYRWKVHILSNNINNALL